MLTADKSSLMHTIEKQPSLSSQEPHLDTNLIKPAVLIVNAMCIVQALKKRPSTTKMLHLKKDFIIKIEKNSKRMAIKKAEYSLIGI